MRLGHHIVCFIIFHFAFWKPARIINVGTISTMDTYNTPQAYFLAASTHPGLNAAIKSSKPLNIASLKSKYNSHALLIK